MERAHRLTNALCAADAPCAPAPPLRAPQGKKSKKKDEDNPDDRLTRIAIVSSDRCKPKKVRAAAVESRTPLAVHVGRPAGLGRLPTRGSCGAPHNTHGQCCTARRGAPVWLVAVREGRCSPRPPLSEG